MNKALQWIVIVTNKDLTITPLHQWFEAFLPRIIILTSANLGDAFKLHFEEVYCVEDYNNDSEFFQVANEILSKNKGDIQALCYLVEQDVERCGVLRDKHGIAGMGHNISLLFRDKNLMKAALEGHVTLPKYKRIDSNEDLDVFVNKVGYPFVLKPLNMYGSTDVIIIHNENERPKIVSGLLAEEFIDGKMFHVDGFMAEGNIFATTVSFYLNGALAFNNCLPLGSVQLENDSDDFQRVIEFTKKVVVGLPPTPTSIFHLELFEKNQSRELVFCEIACRIGGAHVYDVMNHTFGTDVVKLWLAAQMGFDWFDQLQPESRMRHGWILIPPKKGTLKAIREREMPSFVKRYIKESMLPKEYKGATMSVERIASFVVIAENSSQVEMMLKQCSLIADEVIEWAN